MGIHDELLAAWSDYNAQKISAQELKSVSSGFGIYQQKDNLTMMRIRRTGGIVSLDDLQAVAELLEKYHADYVHITTRQALQLHGVQPTDVAAALADCEARGLNFRGGGGNTFRNVLVNLNSGLHVDTAFDVQGYARALAKFFYAYDKAYALPRKIKIAFADRVADRMSCAIQDLGFVAINHEGAPCFEVWIAGGIGNNPRTGIKLFDALPAKECIRVAIALTDLFYDHGDRKNRAKARIRYLRASMGDEGFVELFHQYYKQVQAPEAVPESMPVAPITLIPEGEAPSEGYDDWRAIATEPLSDGTFAVRLFVPYGKLDVTQLKRLNALLDKFGITRLQLAITQDFVIPRVHKQCLAALYNALRKDLGDIDLTLQSYAGHLITCIGNTVCKIGIADSPNIARQLAAALDIYLPANTPERQNLARLLTKEVRISGCPNSCTAHQAARFGFQCRLLSGEVVLVPFSPAKEDPPTLGVSAPTPIHVRDLASYLLANIGVK